MFDLLDTQPMRKRGVYLDGLERYAMTLRLRERGKRANVV
jgi:hypothetical protein